MNDQHSDAARKLQKLGKLLRAGLAKRHPVSQENSEAVANLVQQKYVTDLKDRVRELEDRVKDLEGQIKNQAKAPPTSTPSEDPRIKGQKAKKH